MNIIEAMEKRKSVRSYSKEAVEKTVIEHLRESLNKNGSSLVKGNVRYEVITGYSKEAKTGFLFGIGRINAPAMIVGIYEEEEDLIEIGFCLEREVLYLVNEGYGACFLGTYDENALKAYCKLSENEHIGIVLVFGKPNTDSKFMNSAFRSIAGSTKRKSYEEIMLNANDYNENDKIVDIVKHAIMAPSGNNVQPVRFKLYDSKAVFYLKERRYLVDLGIFLAHFYLYCAVVYDNIEMIKIKEKQESVDGMQPMIMISWQEREKCH